jgi:hypothetical protein
MTRVDPHMSIELFVPAAYVEHEGKSRSRLPANVPILETRNTVEKHGNAYARAVFSSRLQFVFRPLEQPGELRAWCTKM